MFALLVLNSVAWGIADIILSGGFYDPILQLCDYSQNDLTGYGTVLADIACDLTATVIVILSVAQDITMGSNLAWGLLVRNGENDLSTFGSHFLMTMRKFLAPH
ncbi:hypothetical protein BC830DRAFT_1158857 [Chytriomyces sp. MP71]|nr:hypothetical protein BC830DRAFT_1158857 [Chytriomyces sp. MP71]